MKGKCYSQVNRGQRNKNDLYQTPYKMSEALLEYEYFFKDYSVLEPAAAEGAIVKILQKYNFKNIYSYDISDSSRRDFLEEKDKYYQIITNPPFSKANEFIIKAKEICEYKFAFLMKLNYLQGQYRYENIFNVCDNFPLTKIYIFTRMPTLTNEIREDGKYTTGMQAMAWYIWDKKNCDCISEPVIKWIDSKRHIVRKGE